MKDQLLFVTLILLSFQFSCYNPRTGETTKPISGSISVDYKTERVAGFSPFKAHNGVELPYTVVVPTNYDRSQAYPALFVFPSLEYDMEKAQAIQKDFFTSTANENWIIVIAVAPKDGRHGWINHPAHHALNDLMDHIQKDYTIQKDQFHFLGFHDGGVPAATFAGMSKKYVQSLTWVASEDWKDFDEEGYDRLSDLDIPLLLIVGEKDKKYFGLAQQVLAAFQKRKANISLLTQTHDGEQVESLRHGVLLEKLSPNLLIK